MDICVQVGASGAVVHLKSSKIWGVSAGFTTILRANSLPYFFLVCQNLSQRKSRWTDLRTSRNKESRHDISWPVFNPQFKKRLSRGGHSYGCQSQPTIVGTPRFVPEQGWPDGMTFSNQSQFQLSQLWHGPPLKGKKYVLGFWSVALQLAIFHVAQRRVARSRKGRNPPKMAWEPEGDGSQAIFGGFLPFLDRATRLWPWPGFKLQVCHTLNKTCRKHAKFAQIQHEISRSTFQLKMRHTFGQYHQRQNKACGVSEWQPSKGNHKTSVKIGKEWEDRRLPILAYLYPCLLVALAWLPASIVACAQTLRHNMKSKQHSELEMVFLQDREVALRGSGYVPAVQRNECVLNQGPPPKAKHFEHSKIGFWDCNQFMRMHMQTVRSNKQKPSKPWKLSVCESLHSLKSWSPAHPTRSDRLPKPNPRACFQHAASAPSVNWKLETNVSALRICFLPLKYKAKVIVYGDKSADGNVSNQVWQVPSCCDSVFDLL